MTESLLKNERLKFTPELPVKRLKKLIRLGRNSTVTRQRVSVYVIKLVPAGENRKVNLGGIAEDNFRPV